MSEPAPASARRTIVWTNVTTVLGAAILIAAEVFGAAYAGGWALGSVLNLGDYGTLGTQAVFFALGLWVMAAFIRAAQRVEPFTRAE